MQIVAKAEDTVARRIVMPKQLWDQLTEMAEILEAARDIEVTPLDVALIALETGLGEVRRGLAGATTPSEVATATAAAAAATTTRAARAKEASGAQTRSKSASGSQQRSRSGSHKRKRPLKLTADDRAQLEALLLGARSVRARQRRIALWIGHHKRTIHTEWLRQLATDYDAYNVANFAQNMKKDGAYFTERLDGEQRLGWKLTRAGQRHAAVLLENLLATA